ncbi:MAG: NYN domain-containing protein [Candidatus Aminicenantes bacterium]
MAYLIDGSNYLGYTSPSNLEDPKTKHALVSQFLTFQKAKRTKIFVVFDGPPDPNLKTKRHQTKSFSVHYPHPDEDADMIIKKIISKQTDLRRFYVVSSDGEIKNFARRKGAKSLSCAEFERTLKTILKKHRRFSDAQKKPGAPSPLEVDQWLKIFRHKK